MHGFHECGHPTIAFSGAANGTQGVMRNLLRGLTAMPCSAALFASCQFMLISFLSLQGLRKVLNQVVNIFETNR